MFFLLGFGLTFPARGWGRVCLPLGPWSPREGEMMTVTGDGDVHHDDDGDGGALVLNVAPDTPQAARLIKMTWAQFHKAADAFGKGR